MPPANQAQFAEPSLRARHNHPRGFALIATISVMALLVMIALAMSSLATLESRSSRMSKAQNEAQANARLALMMAIGELQKHAGQDQSITAPSGILSTNGFSGAAAHTANQRLLAVFNRRQPDSDAEHDLSSWQQGRQNAFRRWLISGDNAALQNLSYAATAPNGSEQRVKMTSSYTTLDNTVHVPTQTLTHSGKTSRFAWWVDGQGTKASMVLSGETENDLRTLAPDRFGIKNASSDMAWFPSRGNDAQLAKITTMQTADVVGGGTGTATKHEHWLTGQHLAVLADPRRSGLKGDLTSALSSSRAEMENLLGERMFPPVQGAGSNTSENPGGPFWAQAQDYYNLETNNSGQLVVQPQKKDQMGVYPVIASFMEVYGLSNTVGFAPAATPHPRLPAWHYNDRLNQPGIKRPVYTMTAHMTPVVKLWNPYNKPLELSGYTLVVGNNNSQYGNQARSSYDDVILWGRGGGSNRSIDARLPKPMRFEHRYYVPEVSFAPGEVKIFALHENRFLDLEGNYAPWNRAEAVLGKKTKVVQEGWILCDLTEGAFRGFSLWDMHFTKPDVYQANKNVLDWQGGRGIGGYGGADAGDTQILDSNNPSGLNFILKPHRFTTWNIKLFKGRVREDVTTSSQVPLVNMKNINTDVTGYKKEYISFGSNNDPANSPFFVTQGALNSIWARRISLRHLVNDGDNDTDLYNPTAHGTKDIKWLANFNPRSATFGCWPKSYRRMSAPAIPADSAYFQEPTAQITVNGTANGTDGFGLGTTGNFLTGMTEETVGVQQLLWEPFIGYSDIGGATQCALFDVPEHSENARNFFSIGQLRHANLWIENGDYANMLERGHGDEGWFADSMNPAYPIGNSYADPRLKLSENNGRYKTMAIVDVQGSYRSSWYDLSWYLNDQLWDSYYFSAKKQSGVNESHNPRLTLYGDKTLADGADGYHNNAANQLIAGAFNVNSTSPQAWKAFLSSLMGAGSDANTAPYKRTTNPLGGDVTGSTTEDDPDVYTGSRVLNDSELTALAEEVVEQVKERGPFLSLGDFVNRAALNGAPQAQQLMGALQAAIDETDINQNLSGAGKEITPAQVGAVYQQDAYAGDIAAGAPGYLTQGDILSRTGHLMTVRSDTFTIRTYGEATDANGKVLARAWCEATVQRVPDYINPQDDIHEPAYNDDGSANTKVSPVSRRFGRQFVITAFRWIPQSEIDERP
ncbi:MAG: hypothetical protein ACPG32_07135 [Akkermansiaceae bacterium]